MVQSVDHSHPLTDAQGLTTSARVIKVSHIIRMKEHCAKFKFIVAHPSMEVAVSVVKDLSSYTARVLILKASKLVWCSQTLK